MLDPLRYDQLMQCWGAYILERERSLSPQRDSTDMALERHFARALTILERLPCTDDMPVGLAALPVAAVVVESSGVVIAWNDRAQCELFEGDPPYWRQV